ncbi:lipase member M-like [Tiliqua scincoides]|uniref:lipase member M-like n=1 Tax=Tiliqua scincoides TaxID=71010 RepID=UPI003462AFB5
MIFYRFTMWLFMVVACLIQQSANTEESIRKRHLNPQGFMNISEIIDYWGYPSEEYQILTADGYYLQANRIPFGVHSPGKTGHRPAVLLVHGFAAEGRSWIANLPNNSLAFFLADAGYDVWILNCRGTTWSRRHKYLSVDQEEFWNFSFHEMGIYDVPATINFILQKTKQDALYYMAHSQGSAAGLVAFSVMPQLAQKVKLFISFAPAYTLVDTRGFFGRLLSLPKVLKTAIWGNKEFRLLTNHIKDMNVNLCSYPGLDRCCLQVIFTITGLNENNLNVSHADVYAGIFPDFSSVKALIHGTQIFRSNQFKYFDYGSKNKEFYNMTTPPFYKIEDMNVPTAVWYGGNDILTPKKDIELLLPRIPHLVFQKYVPYWEHLECIWGLDAPELIYPDMLFLMQQYK